MLATRVGGYRITERLARGGMGEVYLARHEIMDREAAIKVLHPELTDKKDLVDRFLNEARAAATIRHPGIVEIFDVGHVDGRAFIVMEYLRGELLARRLARTRIDVDKALLLTRQIAGALGAAHACGIIHRDLKPENIVVVPDPDVLGGERTKILDFGIAKLLESQAVVHTMQGAMFGTPAYMAPEQCQDAGRVDRRADLYSLGCIMYELLSGEPPFGRGGMELVAAHLRDQPQPLRGRAPGVSPALESIVMRLLAKDPEERFQTCEALIRALDQVHAEQSATPIPALALAATDRPGAAPVALEDSTADGQSPGTGDAAEIANPTLPAGERAGADATAAAGNAATLPAPASPPGTQDAEPAARTGDTPREARAGVPAARPQRRGLVGLAALVVLVLGLGGLWLLRRPAASVPVAVVTDAGPDARPDASPLEKARLALAERRWDDVQAHVREALELAGDDLALRAEAESLRERAREEQRNELSFRLLERALGQSDVLLAARHYRELTERSVYRADADVLLARVREDWLARAQGHASAGQCSQIAAIEAESKAVAAVLAVELVPIQMLQAIRQQCEAAHRPGDRGGPRQPGKGSGGSGGGGQKPGPGAGSPGGSQPPGGGVQPPGGGGQPPGGGVQPPGGGGETPGGGGQPPGGGGETPGGGGQPPGGGGEPPGGGEQPPGGGEPPGGGGQEPGGGTGVLPELSLLRLQRPLSACARQHDVHGEVSVRVVVDAEGAIDSVTVEPAQEAFASCVRERVSSRRKRTKPGSYQTSLTIP